jgi:DNA processing protein
MRLELPLYCFLSRLPKWQQHYVWCLQKRCYTLSNFAHAISRGHQSALQTLPLKAFLAEVALDLKWQQQDHQHIIAFEDEHYPSLLRTIDDPPAVLYVKGQPETLSQPCIAMVGARKASPMGTETAEAWAKHFAEQGLNICSGLAYGIDAAAHSGANKAAQPSIAVMPAGLAHITPQRHQSLANSITNHGALISELAPKTPPRPFHFPKRNRLISGMSLGTLVVEAQRPSGSLTTAWHALNQNRPLMAIPGAIHHQLAQGCLGLIQQGAFCVIQPTEVLTLLNMPQTIQSMAKPPMKNCLVLNAIDFARTTLNTIARRTQHPIPKLLPILSRLHLSGHIHPWQQGWMRIK